ncbi:MAG: SDR family oxidoreductase [Verrucomicrobiales bacterium]|nr:SDR family oxidoreductase [Verrucomicrobiales bacterium]
MKSQRKIVITGCTRGLGRAMVEGFIARGDRVAGCARNPEKVAELQDPFGRNDHLFESVDVSRDSEVADFSRVVLEKHGPPDLLINSAALINENAPLWEVPEAEFSTVVDVNLKGVTNLIRHFVPAMIENGSGVIVNFSSYWGRSTASEVAPYCATKWGIEGLTSALAQDLPPGLAAVAFNPGVIDTDMLRSCFGSGAGSYSGPDCWAEAAVPFLAGLSASDNGSSVTCPGQ